jgi:Na+/melibiose symporter-like transporter
MSIIPALLLGSGAIFALKYPLKREDHKRLTAELDERRRNYADVQIDPAEAPHN